MVYLLLFVGLSTPIAVSARQDDEPKPTLHRAVFELVGDDGPIAGKVSYQYRVHVPGSNKTINRKGVVTVKRQFELPDLKEPEGRVELWVESASGDRFDSGYFSFSWADKKQSDQVTPIPMKRGEVVSGTVVTATNGQPLANVLVAPMSTGQYGHSYPDFSSGVETNERGEYRLTGRYLSGVATRRPGGIEDRFEFESGTKRNGALLKLKPGRRVRFKIVTPDGRPIAGASLFRSSKSDEKGMLEIEVNDDAARVYLHADRFESATPDVSKLKGDGPHIVTMKPITPVRGRVLTEAGTPPEKCEVWVKDDRGMLHTDFKKAKMAEDGSWEFYSWGTPPVVEVSVVVDGVERQFYRYRMPGVDPGQRFGEPVDGLPTCPDVIETRLGQHHNIVGRLRPRKLYERFPRTIIVTLANPDKAIVRATLVRSDASFMLAGVADGKYEVELQTFNVSDSDMVIQGTKEKLPARQLLNDLHVQTGKSVKTAVEVKGSAVEMKPIALARVALLPGTVSGIAKAASGKPLAHFFVYVNQGYSMDTAGGTHYIARGMTDKDGRFSVSGIIPGEYDVFVASTPRGYGNTVATGHAVVRSGKRTEVTPKFGDDGRKH